MMQAQQPSHDQSPVMFARRASWEGLKLTHYRFRHGEIPEHKGPEHLITLSLGGSCNGEIRTASGFQTRDRDRGNICVIPAGQPYSARLGGESEYLAMFLDPSLVLRAATESRMTSTSKVEVIESCAPNDPVINSIGMALLAELESERLGGRLYAESLANVLAVHVLRHYTTSVQQDWRLVGGMSGRKLRLVLSFIDANYDRDLSLAELASAAGMSTFHFVREFKKTTGKTPHQYLMKFRVDRAKMLLAPKRNAAHRSWPEIGIQPPKSLYQALSPAHRNHAASVSFFVSSWINSQVGKGGLPPLLRIAHAPMVGEG